MLRVLASFPGSSAPEREIEVVHAREPGIFSRVRALKGTYRKVHGHTRDLEQGNERSSEQLTTHI